MPHNDTIDLINHESGLAFDPDVVDVFLEVAGSAVP
jgi:HD-GYP domain-containing protein (c-di-GMP phosphodiesterase class II)